MYLLGKGRKKSFPHLQYLTWAISVQEIQYVCLMNKQNSISSKANLKICYVLVALADKHLAMHSSNVSLAELLHGFSSCGI